MYLPVERNSPAYDHLTPSSAASEISPAQQYDMSAGPSHGNGSTGTPDLSSVSPSSDIDDYLNYQNYAADNMSARQFALSVSGKGKSRMRCARLRTPKAYEQVRVALLRLEADLPPDHRTPWGTWNGTGEAWIYNNPSKESVTVVSGSVYNHCNLHGRTFSAVALGCSYSTYTRTRPRTTRLWPWRGALRTLSGYSFLRWVGSGDNND